MNSRNITVTAHAGSMNTPDNSEESIVAALGIKADILELDVNFLNDMIPVLSHNTPKTPDCVTLEKAFEIIASHSEVSLNLDMKHTYDLKSVEETAKKFSLQDRIFFTGIEEKDVEAVKSQGCRTPYYLNYEFSRKAKTDEVETVCEKIKSLGAVGLNTNFRTLKKSHVDILHQNGLLVSAWTADKKRHMKKLIKAGVDNITTRRPDVLIEILKK